MIFVRSKILSHVVFFSFYIKRLAYRLTNFRISHFEKRCYSLLFFFIISSCFYHLQYIVITYLVQLVIHWCIRRGGHTFKLNAWYSVALPCCILCSLISIHITREEKQRRRVSVGKVLISHSEDPGSNPEADHPDKGLSTIPG